VVKGHVGDENRCRAIVEQTASELGPPAIVISNAASGVLKPLDQIDARGWQWTMGVNARALLFLAQASREGMLAQGGGCIVALSSLGSERVLPGYGIVGTSKAAIEALARYLAVESARDNIRVNVVSAGVVDTDALKHFPNREEMLGEASTRTPAGRMVTPDDVASAVAFLCSNDAWMIRGQTVRVDGGYSLIA
jgi:enoyl-[acyl-carrier protein] reductase III